MTYYRSGGHRPRGFLMATGPGITPGSSLPEGQAIDIGPTILELSKILSVMAGWSIKDMNIRRVVNLSI